MILEVGSHTGSDTHRLLQNFVDPTIHCFEPNPHTCKVFEKYIKSDKVFLHKLAIYDEDIESKEFYASHEDISPEHFEQNKAAILRCEYSSKFTKEDFFDCKLNRSAASSLKTGHDALKGAEVFLVECMRLDTWHQQNEIEEVDLMWIDAQGSESNVLAGAANTLAHTKFIWIEYGEIDYDGGLTRAETIAILQEKGFSTIEKLSDHGAKGDLLFVNKEILKRDLLK